MRITSKGQVTIPVELRERFGLLPYTEVEFVVDGKGLRIQRVPKGRRKKETRGQRAVRLLWGSATTGLTTDEIMKMFRGE